MRKLLGGGDGGIRTPGTLRYNSFQDCRIRPLCHISAAKVAIHFKKQLFFNKKLNSKLKPLRFQKITVN